MLANKPGKNSANSPTKPQDRRIRRTRKLLKEALVELILEKGYDDINVAEIIERADVGRTSFYTHFRSKEDLLLQNLDDLEHLFAPQEKKEKEDSPGDFSLYMFQHLKQNWRLARLLLGNKKIPFVRNHVNNILRKYYIEEYRKRFAGTRQSLQIEAAAVMKSGALLSLTLWWLAQKKPLSPEKMHELFENHV